MSTTDEALKLNLDHLEQIVCIDPDHAEAWEQLTAIYLQRKAFGKAEAAARKTLGLRPPTAGLLTQLGSAITSQQRYTEALPLFQQAIALQRDCFDAWAQLGITQHLRNDLFSARETLQHAISLFAYDATTLRHLALVEVALGNRTEAVAHFERLVRLQPMDQQSRLDLAVVLLSQQDGNAALRQLNRIGEPLRSSARFRFYQALALQQNGHAVAAQTLLEDLANASDIFYGFRARQWLQQVWQ